MPEDGRSAAPDIDPIRAFAEGSPTAVILLGGPAHRILYANPAFHEAAARPPAKLLGLTVAEAFPDLAASGHLAVLDRVRTTGTTCRRPGQALRLRPDAAPRFWDVEVVPLRDRDGAICGVLAQLHDATAQQAALREAEAARARQALLASEERFRTLAEAMPHLVWQTDARGEPEYLNRRLQAYLGQDLAALRDGRWFSVLHPEDAPLLARNWGVALAGGGDYDVDARLRGADGSYRWFRVKGAPVRDAAGAVRHWVGTCTDVEEQHHAEAALHQALAAQQALAREAEHRIKNSLQLVAALLRLQAARVAEPAAHAALQAATIRVQAVAEAHRALQKSPDLRNVRLADMLRELVAGAAMQHPGADLRIEAPEALMLDAERAIPLALILAELAGNALRRGGPDGRSPGPVWLSARLAEGALLVEMADSGQAPPERGLAASLGDTVIQALARQIGAKVATETAAGGTRVLLTLALEPPSAAPP